MGLLSGGDLVDASGLVGSGVLVEPFLEVGKLTSTFVGDSGFVVLGVPDESGVASDFETVDLVGGGIELGNNKVLNILDVFTKLFPDGGELLAVTAPGSVVLNEHILGGVCDNLCPLLSDEFGDGALGLGDLLGLEVNLKLIGLEVVDESLDLLNVDSGSISGVDELSEVLRGVNQTDGGEVSLLNSNEFSKSGLDAIGDTRLDEENLSLELVGGLEESLLGIGVGLFGEEDEGGSLVAEDGLDGVLGEGDESSLGLDSDEVGDVFSGEGTGEGNDVLVEVTEDSGAGEGNTVLGGAGLLSVVVEGVVLGLLGNLEEGVEVLTVEGGAEVDEVAAVSGLGLKVGAVKLVGGGAGLLVDPGDDGVLLSATSVVLSLSVAIGT